jgi:acrylyl-CoA reductase (NADPH)
MFKALVLNKHDDAVTAAVEQLDEARLPEGDVTVAVEHSTLNYKDGLIIADKAPLVRSFPHVPGIDFAGRVVAIGGEAGRLAHAGTRCRISHWRGGRPR